MCRVCCEMVVFEEGGGITFESASGEKKYCKLAKIRVI